MGEAGIVERPPAPTLKEFGVDFMKQIEMECASKPATVKFYREKLSRLEAGRLAAMPLDKIDQDASGSQPPRRLPFSAARTSGSSF